MPFEDPPSEAENTKDGERNRYREAGLLGGRPLGSTKLQPTDETFKQINGLSRIQCTQREAAAVLGVHVDTFRAFLNAHEKAMEAWEQGAENGKASLRRNQYKMSETNPTMAIWLGKQWLGQKDNMVLGGDPEAPVAVTWIVRDPRTEPGTSS